MNIQTGKNGVHLIYIRSILPACSKARGTPNPACLDLLFISNISSTVLSSTLPEIRYIRYTDFREHTVYTPRHRIRTRQKGRQRSSLLDRRNTWMSHFSHLEARVIWRKLHGRTSILEGWWFGVVSTGWSSIFPKHPFAKFSFFFSYFSSNHPGTE